MVIYHLQVLGWSSKEFAVKLKPFIVVGKYDVYMDPMRFIYIYLRSLIFQIEPKGLGVIFDFESPKLHIYNLGCPLPFPVIVSTRITTFLVQDPYKPLFSTSTGKGDNPTYNTYQNRSRKLFLFSWFGICIIQARRAKFRLGGNDLYLEKNDWKTRLIGSMYRMLITSHV